MQLKDVPIPEPQDREVLIRVGYAGVNPADTKARAGHSARGGIDIEKLVFHSSRAWMLQVSWSEQDRMPRNSGKEIV